MHAAATFPQTAPVFSLTPLKLDSFRAWSLELEAVGFATKLAVKRTRLLVAGDHQSRATMQATHAPFTLFVWLGFVVVVGD